MQTVQLSSLRAMTPRGVGGGSSLLPWGPVYWTVTAGVSMVCSVTARPFTSPGTLGLNDI